MKIIALTGQQGAGKSTLADRVASHLRASGYRVTVASFADALKRTCWDLFGVPYDRTMTQEQKNTPRINGRTSRQVWQKFGQDARDIWADVWVALSMATLPDVDVVIFDDLRHVNEMDAVHDRGGLVIHLTDTPHGVGTHESDVALLGYEDHFDDSFSPREIGLDAAIMRIVALVG